MAGRGRRAIAGILFSIALVAILAFVFLLFVRAEQIDSVPGSDMIETIAIAIAVVLGVIAILMALLMISRRKQTPDATGSGVYFISGAEERRQARPEPVSTPAGPHDDQPTPPPSDVRVYDLWNVPLVLRSWDLQGQTAGGDELDVYSYPCNVQTAVYANDYIEVADGVQLKLRTLLAGPENVEDYMVTEPRPPQEDAWEPERPQGESGWEADEDASTASDDTPEGAPSDRPDRPRRRSDDFMAELDRRFEERQN